MDVYTILYYIIKIIMSLSYNSWFFKLNCYIFAKRIGKDKYGNTYYSRRNKSPKNNFRKRRLVVYSGRYDASKKHKEGNAREHHLT